jgi:hypothetical protein
MIETVFGNDRIGTVEETAKEKYFLQTCADDSMKVHP